MINKIKILGLLLFLMIGQFAFGQESFNYQKDFENILEKTKDLNDELSYDKLLKRFTVNDTTMTDFEVLALLIGYTGKPEFNPYKYLDKEKEIYRLNHEGKYKEALDSANIFLEKHPVNQRAIIEKSYSHYKLNDKDSADFYMHQFGRIMWAMYFSGDGKTVETPIFALGPTDGQNYILKFIGAEIGAMSSGFDSYGNLIDILEAKFEDGESMMLHFIIEHATGKIFDEKKKNIIDDTM